MRSRRRLAATGLTTAVLLTPALLSGCAGVTTKRTAAGPGQPVTVGAIYPLSGPQGEGGTSEERGAALAAQWVDEHGGIGGRPISIVAVDAPTADAVPSAMAQLSGRRIRILVGTHGSTISAVAARLAASQHQLLWETGAVGNVDMGWPSGGYGATKPGPATGNGIYGNNTDTIASPPTTVDADDRGYGHPATGPAPVAGMGRTFFRMSPQGSSLGRAGIGFVLDQIGPQLPDRPTLKVAVAYVHDAYGDAVAQGVMDQVRQAGVELAGAFPYPEFGTDFAGLAEQIKASGANVLYASSYLADGEALRRATIAAHIPLLASVGTSSSYCLPAFGNDLGAEAVGLFASDKAASYSINPQGLSAEGRQTLEWAQAAYRQRYGGDMDAYATSGFANAYALFAHVMPQAQSLDPPAIATAATKIKLPVGSLADGSGMDFPAGGPQAGANQAAASVIWEWVAPGREVVVWPTAFATQAVQLIPPAS